jgi:hypothetical protein
MTAENWIQMGAGFLAGGAMGAILKAAFDTYQKRVQPVGYRIQFVKIFKDTLGLSTLKAELQVTDGVETRHFQNLFIAEITLTNRGNEHIDEFQFGITLGGEDVALYTEPDISDRHHSLTQTSQVALGGGSQEVDFVCKPFNRKDKYSFKVFLSIPHGKAEPEDIVPSTSHPIRFVNMDRYETFFITFINLLGNAQIVEKTRVRSD